MFELVTIYLMLVVVFSPTCCLKLSEYKLSDKEYDKRTWPNLLWNGIEKLSCRSVFVGDRWKCVLKINVYNHILLEDLPILTGS